MKKCVGLLGLLLFLTAGLLFGGESIQITENGSTDYVILLPEEATVVQKTAASELASFLKQISGADFAVAAENEAQNAEKALVIGPSAKSKELLAQAGCEPEETISADGIIIETVGDSVVLSGDKGRGPLYAVYTFLEDTLGCRWWTSTESTIPNNPTIAFDPIHVRYAPKLISRESFYLDPLSGETGGIFSARTKMNGNFNRVPEEYGGHLPILFWAHSCEQLIPPGEFAESHPEWFALIGGERRTQHAQLCLTNPEMKAEFKRRVLANLRANPGTKFVSVSQNDCGGWCECPECQKLKDENNSQAGPLITFVNEIAEAIEAEFPDVLVETLAYNDSRFAPSKVKPRDNVVIRLCTIECSFLTPLAEGGPNQVFLDNIEKWSAISKNLYIWDYVTNFHNYMLPRPNYQVLAPNIRFFIDHHAVGIFEQGDAGCTAGDFVRLRNWVISKLLWDPSLDQTALEDEFMAGYYAPELVPILRQYFDILKDAAFRANVFLPCYMMATDGWLDTPTLIQATELMQKARETAKQLEADQPEKYAGLTKKMERESLPIEMLWITERPFRQQTLRIAKVDPQEDSPIAFVKNMKAYYEKWAAVMKENHVGTVKEGGWGLYPQWLSELEVRCQDSEPATDPEEIKDVPPECWFDAQEFDFRISGLGEFIYLEDDPAASNKKTARMPATHTVWAAAYYTAVAPMLTSPTDKPLDENGRASCRVLIYARCDMQEGVEPDDQATLAIGVYDEENAKGLCGRMLSAKELAGPEYKAFELGPVPLNGRVLAWTAPTKRPDAVANVYVDRIVLIRE